MTPPGREAQPAAAPAPDLGFATATELVAALTAKDLSSRELLDHYLARVERCNPALNAVVVLDVERARADAARADAAIARGERLGPLHGLPMTVKESWEAEGMRTTCGAPELADHVSARDAVPVARLRAAGAVIFGKTNLPIWTGEGQAFNEVYGVTSNPWDLARGPGGSSGGAGAAIAAGLSGLELGSDIAGSVRNPAHMCGVFGFIPSYGVAPLRGHVLPRPGDLAPLDMFVPGPLARGADDLELALDAIAGPLEEDARAWRLALPAPRARALRDFRLAAWLDDPWAPVDREVLAVLEPALDALRRDGARIGDERPVELEASDRLYRQLLAAASGAGRLSDGEDAELRRAVAALPPEADDERARLLRGLTQSKRAWDAAHERRMRLRARWAAFFERHDALLCPVVSTPAFPHQHTPMAQRTIVVNGETRSGWDHVVWAGLANVAYLPAASVPVGRTAGGLPVGLQVIGPYLEDRTVLELTRRIAESTGGYVPPPGW